MRTITTYGTFDDIVDAAPVAVQEVARHLRDLITAVYPDVVEVAWPSQGVIGYGIGPRKQLEHFCYLAVHRDHLNLGFNHGAHLPDPEGLLGGSGKAFRHIMLTPADDLAKPALQHLIEAAYHERLAQQSA